MQQKQRKQLQMGLNYHSELELWNPHQKVLGERATFNCNNTQMTV